MRRSIVYTVSFAGLAGVIGATQESHAVHDRQHDAVINCYGQELSASA